MEENKKDSNLKERVRKLLEYLKKKDDSSYIEWINKKLKQNIFLFLIL